MRVTWIASGKDSWWSQGWGAGQSGPDSRFPGMENRPVHDLPGFEAGRQHALRQHRAIAGGAAIHLHMVTLLLRYRMVAVIARIG